MIPTTHIRSVIAAILLMGMASVPSIALAQSGGTAPPAPSTGTTQTTTAPPAPSSGTAPSASSAPPAPAPASTQGLQAPAAPSGTGVAKPVPAVSSGPPITGSTNAAPVGSAGPPVSGATQQLANIPPESTPSPQLVSTATVPIAVEPIILSPWLWPLVAGGIFVLAIIPFGLFFAGFFKKKPAKEDESQNRCFDIKQLMDDKLKELTDVQAMIKEQATEKGKEALREAVEGTKTGDALVRLEKLQEQYNKLKALYEECKIDVDHYKYKGVLIENSLLNKSVLEHLRIIRTRTVGDRILHDIRLSTAQIEEIQKNMESVRWYFHLWEPGKDAILVVFKDVKYQISHSNKATWKDAIDHGVSCGIPAAEMDFEMV